MFCRICEFGWDGAGLTAPRRPAAGEAADADVAAGFLTAPARAVPSAFLEVAAAGTAVGPACLAAEAPPEGVPESHGLLGMAPLQPEGAFLMTGLAAAMPPRGDFFGRRLLGAVCLPAEEPGRAVFLETAAAVALSSTLLSSFTARTDRRHMRRGAGVASKCTRGTLNGTHLRHRRAWFRAAGVVTRPQCCRKKAGRWSSAALTGHLHCSPLLTRTLEGSRGGSSPRFLFPPGDLDSVPGSCML